MAIRAPRPLVSADRTATIAEVARLMDQTGTHLVVVTDGRHLVGVVTERDIVVRGVANRYPADARIEAVTSTDMANLPPDADRDEAVAAFLAMDDPLPAGTGASTELVDKG